MRAKFQAVVLLLVLTAVPRSHAQQDGAGNSLGVHNHTSQIQSSAPAQLLSLDEGLAVIGAAMEMGRHRRVQEDCSHFVHDIYQRAGFPYSYQNSVGLYDGTSDFERVTRPQPGDLIVWRGHIGIMVNPAQHSFYSLLRTGFGVEKYDSRYWRKRGHPRFYRYIKTTEPALTLASAKTRSETEDNADDATEVPPTTAPPGAPNPDRREDAFHAQADPLIVSAAKASPAALGQALEDKLSESNTYLANTDLLNFPKPVVIVDDFQIKKVHVKHDRGWAEVRLNERSSIAGGAANLQRRSEKQRWPLYRMGTQWQMELPTDAVYLPKGTAVRLLAHQLATMTGRIGTPAPGGTQQEAQLARLLDHLLGE